MPVPLTSLTVAEIIMHGDVAAAGAQSRVYDYVWHMRRTATTNSPTELALANAFMTNVGSVVMAALNVRATNAYCSVRFMQDWTRRPVKVVDTTPGARTGDSMVMDDCAFIYWSAMYRGQSGVASKHLYPMSEGDTTTDGDVFNATCITRLQAIVTAFLAGFTDATSNTWVPVVYSRTQSRPKILPLATIVTNDLVTGFVRKSIGDMKTRRPKITY